MAQCGAFQNSTVAFAGDYLAQGIGVAVDSHKHQLDAEPNLPSGKAGLKVLPILFLHFFFFLFIQLPGFLGFFLSVFSTDCHYLPLVVFYFVL